MSTVNSYNYSLMKTPGIIFIAVLAIAVTTFVFILSIAELEAPTLSDDKQTAVVDDTTDTPTSDESKQTDVYIPEGFMLFASEPLGVQFLFPISWGTVVANVGTPQTVDASYRTESLVESDMYGPFMSTYTDGDIMGRGGYWADYVIRTQTPTQVNALCDSIESADFGLQPSKSCATFQNVAGINFVQLHGDVDWYGEITKNVDLYLAHHPNNEYYGVAFSTQGFAVDTEVPEEIAQEMYRLIMSFEYID